MELEVPAARLVGIEYPGYVRSEAAVLRTLGGLDGLARQLQDNAASIALEFRWGQGRRALAGGRAETRDGPTGRGRGRQRHERLAAVLCSFLLCPGVRPRFARSASRKAGWPLFSKCDGEESEGPMYAGRTTRLLTPRLATNRRPAACW